jgi:cobalt-zinc-cadmium resistance protein CzcA
VVATSRSLRRAAARAWRGRIQSLDEIGDVLIETREDGVPVRVRDVARVHLAPLIRQGAVTRDGRGEVVTGIVMMLVGANGREVVENVKAKITQIAPSLPPGVRIDVFYDRSDLVNRTIHTVGKNLAEGALFVIAVLFLLLGSIRGGLIVAAAIPFAMLVAFTAMKALGLSGNLMSLGAIDFGIVVDGSIIVVENAVVHLAAAARGQKRPMTYGEAADVVLNSTLDVRKAALFGEAIIVIVYIPILTLAGSRGEDVQADGHHGAVRAARCVRRLADFRAGAGGHVPAAAHRGEGAVHRAAATPRVPAPPRPADEGPEEGHRRVARLARGEWRRGLAHGRRVRAATRRGSHRDSDPATAERFARGERARRDALRAGLREFPEVVTVVSKTGRAEIATDPMGVELSDCIVILKPQDQWTTAHTREELSTHVRALR